MSGICTWTQRCAKARSPDYGWRRREEEKTKGEKRKELEDREKALAEAEKDSPLHCKTWSVDWTSRLFQSNGRMVDIPDSSPVRRSQGQVSRPRGAWLGKVCAGVRLGMMQSKQARQYGDRFQHLPHNKVLQSFAAQGLSLPQT